MTVINPNSISGIASVTAQGDIIQFYKSDGTLGAVQFDGANFNTTSGVSTFKNLYVGGTLTYEDVKNVDSVGLITARNGIKVTGGDVQVGSAVTVDTSGINVTGVVTATSYKGDGSQLSGIEAAPTAQLVTSENLVAGDTVIVKTNGQVEKVAKNVTQITPVNGQSVEIGGSAN